MLSTDSEEFRVIMDKSIGYINATKMCYVGGKDFKDWSRLKGSYELIQALEKKMALQNTQSNDLEFNLTLQHLSVQICTDRS